MLIFLLVPSLGKSTATRYANVIEKQANRYQVSQLLLVANAWCESRFVASATSGKGDYGICQIRARAWNLKPLDLLHPTTNLKVCAKMVGFWKRYHRQHCSDDHHYIAHMQWGTRPLKTSPCIMQTLRLLKLLVGDSGAKAKAPHT